MSKMAAHAAELSTLRALTFRISTTPTSQLPPQVPAIAASLANCKSLLASAQGSASKSASEASVAVHKLRTLLATLLQDRHVQGRWAAIVLIKACVEIGGWETLSKSLPWVRGLFGILTKPDPPSAKKLCLITLTRIFVLTRDYPTLVREITTPSLPVFVQTCLQLATSKTSPSMLHTVLECFNQLLPRHPTIFRSYLKQLQQLLVQIVAPTPSNRLSKEQVPGPRFPSSQQVTNSARRLFAQLPCCAPKGGSSEEWEKGLKAAITNAHHVASKVFRAVVEEWHPSSGATLAVKGITEVDQVQELEADSMGLPPWSGIYAGGERLTAMLEIVHEYIISPTAGTVNLQVGPITDLLTRVFMLTVPTSTESKDFQHRVRFNNQISKEERENLWAVLPTVHAAALDLLLALTQRCSQGSLGLEAILLDQVVWVFNAEKANSQVRTACYIAIRDILMRCGGSLPKMSIESLGSVIRKCCDDILPSGQISGSGTVSASRSNGQTPGSTNADTFLGATMPTRHESMIFVELEQAALELLPVLFRHLVVGYLSNSIRTLMDRTAILVQHKEAMLASVLNPPPSKRFSKAAASLLPFVARSFPGDPNVESLIRPRMPVLRIRGQDLDSEDDNSEESEEGEQQDLEMDHPHHIEEENDHFVGQELDNLLGEPESNQQIAGDSIMANAPVDDTIQQGSLESAEPPGHGDVLQEDFSAAPAGQATISKRYIGEDEAPSPSKRVKVDAGSTTSVEATTANIPIQVFDNVTGDSDAAVVVAPALSVTQVAEPAGEIDSDDDDDFGELTLAQDTDEEYDD